MNIYKVSATCEIADVVANLLSDGNPLENRIVFCEDKFTLQIELAIAKKCGGTFGTNVYSFNRYMHSRLKNNKKVLSPEGCTLVVKGLLLDNKNKLMCFKNVYDPNLAGTIYQLIAQLKSAKVTPNDIKKATEETTGNLKRKLSDIYLLFDGYENYIKEKDLTDGNNRLYSLCDFIESDSEIKNTKVIVAGFPSLNKTLCEIFKALFRNAKSLDFVVVAGDNKGVYTSETFNFASEHFVSNVIDVKGNPTRTFMLSRLYNPENKGKEGKYSSNIHVYRAKNAEEEIEHVAGIIKRSVINGSKYQDFAIATEDIKPFELSIKRIFEDYEIPLFFDSSIDLGKHPLTRLITSFIDVVRRNFDFNDVIQFVKNPLFIVDKEISDGFENYFIKCGINRKTILENFTEDDENIEIYENIRKKIVALSSGFPKKPTFKESIEQISKMIENVKAFDNLELINNQLESLNKNDLVSINNQIKDKFEGVISDALSILSDKIIPLKEVKNIILTGMTACKVSVIAEKSDCVFVSDFRACKYQKNKNLFAIGLNDGIPSSKLDSALLCDRDIARMEKSKVLVEPKIREVNRRARETCCMALASFCDNLYISYSTRSVANEDVMPSELISYILSAFSEKSKGKVTKVYDLLSYENIIAEIGGYKEKNYKARKYLSSRTSLFAFSEEISNFKEGATNDFTAGSTYYEYIKDKEDGQTASKILNSANSEVGYYTKNVDYCGKGLSATAIEGYFDCPYKNFLSRGLKLREREEGKIKANDLGTMLHAIAEKFAKEVDFYGSFEDALKLAEKIIDEISNCPDYARYKRSESGKRAFELIEKEALDFCSFIFESASHSLLKPKYMEVSFGKRSIPPIKVETESGIMEVNGKVDRIDTYEDYMRIVDYKTGSIDPSKDDKLFYMGKKLQLYLYAQAFNEKYKPIGVYYFPVSGDYTTDTEEEIMQLKGKTIADNDKAELMDDTILERCMKGKYINANLTTNKNGSFKSKTTLLSEDEFNYYMEYAKSIAGMGLNEIKKGVIIPSPSKDSCSYCKYKGICGYDSAIDERDREFSSLTKENIVRAVTGEKQDDLKEEN